ncbi:MAG TPA: bifunctional phosphopantothenoylcysteine decarboxylase/phosphopantothenate--cysteine ligase CoaBC [Bacteroidota bacterium]|nr:bifunctional phosphopantothenoylcysteine decarboxylase/phosphopantothenate--cysteine ligase CoaBC [Bacteroidota bacterium]
MIKGKKVLVGVTGGIAAYKIPWLVRRLKTEGAEVQVVMTESAQQFTTAFTLSTLSGNEVITGTFPQHDTKLVRSRTWHVDLGRWADCMVVAPATANTIAKLASGISDNAVTTLALALRCPLLVSPAMDLDMWDHATTKSNVAKLQELGYVVLPPDSGELASGLRGAGRLPEVEVIVEAVDRLLSHASRDLEGVKIVVSAGPTHEPIDPVRFLGNRSSGKMGFAIANAAAQRGASVTLVSGPVHLQTPRNVRRIDVETSRQMFNAIAKESKNADALVMAAAVADFTPAKTASQKIKKEKLNSGGLELHLTTTKDILGSVAENKNGKVIVGFALETENGLANARKKLKSKNLDLIVLNNPHDEGAAFGSDTNVVTMISSKGAATKLKKMSKFDVANEILDRVAPFVKKRSGRKNGRH